MKRLAIFMHGLYGGGVERTILNLGPGMAARGVQVDLVVVRAAGPYLAEVPPSMRLVDLRAPRAILSLPALARYLRRERPDALLSTINYTNVIALWARRLAGVPLRVVTAEHDTYTRWITQLNPTAQRIMRRLTRFTYPWADATVAVSQGVANDLAQAVGLPRDHIHVIYNPVITADVQARAQAQAEHPWLQPGQPPVVLGVGRMTRQKDFPTLIEAFAQVRAARPARLIILGEGDDRPALEAQIARLGLSEDVSLPGFVANPYACMRAAAVFALSSRWEGLPTVLIEALYCGAALVSTDCPSGPSEILQGGQYGRLVPMGDAPALAQAILAALAEGRPQFPPESWRPYEMDTAVDQYMQILLGD